ncbi:peptide MFS transporter [Haoranjiania flava]|uniref:Peptide MFS transporter n=1 Tax=Haoranjiania flava TaxID=1856322 RepID=A0AAE3IKV6_9BACT|nr:peptide MFS transporter [Haoranjiania flava]MCU7693618.1 peptide MFS transporter [Haoranjiania flava]
MHRETLEEIQSFEGKYPKQLWHLFFSEMWERFCFYGMRGMLTFFMVHELFMKEDQANLQYGATQAFVYAFTFIGGLFADKILGFRKSLFWGGILMIAGSLILATDPHKFFFLGISVTVIGTGFFKPNISTMVGQLYKDGDPRRDAGFSLFYTGINLGALLGGYVCVAVGKGTLLGGVIPENIRWNIAFGFAAVVMTISLITFIFTKRHLGSIGLAPERKKKVVDYGAIGNNPEQEPVAISLEPGRKKSNAPAMLVYAGSLLAVPVIMKMVATPQYTDWFMYIIGPATLIFLFYEMTKCTKPEIKRLFAALIFIAFSIVFWAFFEQSGGSLSLFAANNLDDKLLGFIPLDPNGVNNSANALFVIIFAWMFGLVWLALAKKRREPNTVVKFGMGFLFLGLSFLMLFGTRFFQVSPGIAGLDMFTLAYLVMTFGELCLSPIGLSTMTKLSPPRLQGMMMGMWFLASAYGQYVAGLLGAGMAKTNENGTLLEKLIAYTEGYKQLGIYAIIAGVILIAISPLVRKLMQGVR